LQATIRSPFKAPTREANQPGTKSTVDSSDGNILASPYFDGTSIWFTHAFDFVGFPTVRYGAVKVSTNTVATAMAFRSATSDDFNPSLAVGLGPSGTSVYLNWAFTDAPAGTATSDVVDMLPAGQPIANLIGTGAVYAVGSTTSQTRFGDFSSVEVDPQVPGGTCAVAAQQYFSAGGTWNTRLARLGTCQPPVLVPDVRNDKLPEAALVLAAAGLTVGQVTNVLDHTCNNIGTVLGQNPGPGTPVQAGSADSLAIGRRPPPPFQCPWARLCPGHGPALMKWTISDCGAEHDRDVNTTRNRERGREFHGLCLRRKALALGAHQGETSPASGQPMRAA
jgi:hypothetical protein